MRNTAVTRAARLMVLPLQDTEYCSIGLHHAFFLLALEFPSRVHHFLIPAREAAYELPDSCITAEIA